MIVDPDFVDHWKTRMLVDLLGNDEVAPVYVIRLWAHCQQRREWRFDPLPTAALKAICRYRGDAESFEDAMLTAGFVAREGQALTAVGWEEYNASLIANWSNGQKGGRPKGSKNKPKDNPPETHGLPTDNPPPTHGEPIRVDEIGEEKNGKETPKRVAELSSSDLVEDGVTEETATEFLALRRKKGAPLTPRAWKGVKSEAAKAGWSNEDAVAKCLARGWTGFEAEWVATTGGKPSNGGKFDPVAHVNRNRFAGVK